MSEPSTEGVQHWMGAVLRGRGDLRQKLGRAARDHGLGIEQVLAARRGPSLERRLDVYAAGYVLRLVECLSSDFPALRAFLGEHLFETFARAYIVEHPPRARSLFDLGREFPRFLARTQPSPEQVPTDQRAFLGLPANLARLERAASDASRALGLEAQAASPMGSALDALTGRICVRAAPCLQLLSLDYELVDFCRELEQGGSLAPPRCAAQHVAVSRSRYRVTRTALTSKQHDFLRWCESQPEPISPLAWPAANAERGTLLSELLVWLPVAEELGCVQLVPFQKGIAIESSRPSVKPPT